MTTPADFPAERPGGHPFFGYAGFCADRSIHEDRPDWLQECIDRGYIDPDCGVLGGQSIRRFCKDRGATKCEKLLARLGWRI